jgi:hypothetical protein
MAAVPLPANITIAQSSPTSATRSSFRRTPSNEVGRGHDHVGLRFQEGPPLRRIRGGDTDDGPGARAVPGLQRLSMGTEHAQLPSVRHPGGLQRREEAEWGRGRRPEDLKIGDIALADAGVTGRHD